MSTNPLPENLRENIRRLVQSMKNGSECRLGCRRPIKDKERSLRARRQLLKSILKTAASTPGAHLGQETGQEGKPLLRCLYREHFTDGAHGPLCGAPFAETPTGKEIYCARHAYLCSQERCGNLVDSETKKCGQCQRQHQPEGVREIVKLSA